MGKEQLYEGPLGQYILEIAVILLVSFILGYLFRLLLNDGIKDQLSDLELENEVLKKQLSESTSKGNSQAEAKLKQSEAKVRELNDRLSDCIAKRVKAENTLSLAEGELKKLQSKPTDNKVQAESSDSLVASSALNDENEDDLTKIEGVGPKIQQLLYDGQIKTYSDIISTTPEEIRKILIASGPTYAVHDPSTWGEQAKLASEAKWDELKQLQEELKGGKRTK